MENILCLAWFGSVPAGTN